MQTPPEAIAGANTPLRSIEEYRGRNDPEAIKAVAQEMEAMFAYELLKAMRATSNAPSQSGLGANTYTSLFDMELSKLIAKRGIGLKNMLLKGIEKQMAVSPETSMEKSRSQEMRKPDEDKSIATDGAAALQKSPLPAGGGSVSSGYGMRPDPFTKKYRFHHGMDIAAPEGSDVKPVKEGNVIFSGEQKGYGNVVVIDHSDGFITKYAHNQLNLVKEGDRVTSNTVIARVGHTGRSTGSHVHFEVTYNGKYIDPAFVLEKKV
jgi:murein DD-endopeptidase MepM/ murein hydrolase activator NlpD